MRPQLSRMQVDSLMRYRHEPIEPAEVYGHPIGYVTDAHSDEWLEAGVTAGFVPHFDALELVVRANHVWLRAEEAEFRVRGVDGDADGNLRGAAEAYRQLTLVLEELIEDCELGLALSFGQGPSSADDEAAALYASYSVAAEARARAASERRRSTLTDVKGLERLESMWSKRDGREVAG